MARKNDNKIYYYAGAIVVVGLGAWMFLTTKGKAVKDSILAMFK